MFEFIQFGSAKLELFLMILTRVSGLFLLAPVLGDKSFPVTFRIALAIILSLILVPILGATTTPTVSSTAELVVRIGRELLIGLIIGFLFRLLFMGVQAAGSLVGYQIGLSIANVIDPTSHSEQSIISQFWMLLAMLIFLTINGHHLLISGLADSFTLLPLGGGVLNDGGAELLMRVSGFVLVLAVKLAIPVIVTLFLIDIAMASVSRMMPTMNVFIVGFGLKIGAGVAIMAVSLPVFVIVLKHSLTTMNTELSRLLTAMAG